MVHSSDARAKMLEIWEEARKGGLTEENMVAYIDALEEELQQSQRLNFLRWPIMNQKVHQNPRTWGSYSAEVQNVRRFMKERFAWMDSKLGYNPNLDGISTTKLDDNRPYTIWSVDGQSRDNLAGQPNGVYIIRQGQTTHKVVKTK